MIVLPEPCRFVSFIEKPVQEEQTQFCILIEEGKDGENAAYRQLIISKQYPFKKVSFNDQPDGDGKTTLGFNIRPLSWSQSVEEYDSKISQKLYFYLETIQRDQE